MKAIYKNIVLGLCFAFHIINVFSQPGASIQKKVIVPESMKSSPFNTDRYLNVPENFDISVFARINGARFMAIAPNGDLLVSVPSTGKVKIVRTVSGRDPLISDFVTGLNRPHDIVFHKIDTTVYVYIAGQNQINRYKYTNGDTTAQNKEIVVANLPDASLSELQGNYAHALKNIALDLNHKLYISIASSCNACTSDTESDPVRGAIYIYNADGTNGRLFAQGIRNAEGLAFIPGTNTLWAVVNNRDNMIYPYDDNTGNYGETLQWFVNNNPPEEFIKVTDGANFGWPFCNPDPTNGLDNMPFSNDYELNKNGATVDCNGMTPINKGIQAHSAPLGFIFLQQTAFPQAYRNGAAVGLHGSWNREKKTGYKVIYFPWDSTSQGPGNQIDLVTGFLSSDSTTSYGRPVDVAVTLGGDLLISDDQSGTIYKMTYTAPITGLAEVNASKDILSVYPVPAHKTLNVKYISSTSGTIKISFTNSHGKQVSNISKKISAGENSFTLNVETLLPGVYTLIVTQEEKATAKKIIIE